MRYFLISFNPDNVLGFGTVLIQNEDFPSYTTILESIKRKSPDIKSIAIISIFEFQNKYDYLNYTGEING